jgi:REase_MTES_1575
LRFGESREDWVELFGLNLEQIDEQAATVYLKGEKKYFGRFADHCIRAVGPEHFFAMKQTKLEKIRGRFIRAATHLCGKMDDGKRSPIEQITLAGLQWARYLYERKPAEIWDSTSGLGKPQADVVIAPQYQTENCRIDLAVFINVFANEETKIAVECDGHKFHTELEQVGRDTARNGDLTIAGWRLQRFTGRQIRRNPNGCAARVAKLVENEITAQFARRGFIS